MSCGFIYTLLTDDNFKALMEERLKIRANFEMILEILAQTIQMFDYSFIKKKLEYQKNYIHNKINLIDYLIRILNGTYMVECVNKNGHIIYIKVLECFFSFFNSIDRLSYSEVSFNFNYRKKK